MRYGVESNVLDLNEAKLHICNYAPDYSRQIFDLNEKQFVKKCNEFILELEKKLGFPTYKNILQASSSKYH
jgi:hypothetical protein